MDRARGLRDRSPLNRRRALALAALALWAGASGEGRASTGVTWILETAGLQSSPGATDLPAPVGSLQKPFVAEAWARVHGDAATPRFTCRGGASCWLKTGHGTLGLARATALSCNAYFTELAGEVPPPALASTFREEGFRVAGLVSPDAAIGMDRPPDIVTITPRGLLEAYVRLTRVPWLSGDAARREVLAGLRDSPLEGTARRLGHLGYWAKTGTVGRHESCRTVGWALAVDDSGWAMLARLEPATGREAAALLGATLTRERPWSVPRSTGLSTLGATTSDLAGPTDHVRVRLFEKLRPRAVAVRNLGTGPVSTAAGFVGPGAALSLRPGDRLGESSWEVRIPGTGLVRVLQAALSTRREEDGTLAVVAEMERREYASGVIAAELLEPDAGRRVELGAAVLRFLGHGPRHADSDVCDSTHCAFFIGRGPRVVWTSPGRAVPAGAVLAPLDDASWSRVLEEARRPGPDQWTSHCGGRPLSAHAVWGNGDRSLHACALHGPAEARAWSRAWSGADLARAFGSAPRSLRVREDDGVWGLEVEAVTGKPRVLLYDEAHRLLAAVLGWGALPSPADRVLPSGGGWRAFGVGLGHRVGLCLGPTERRQALLQDPTSGGR
jgi:hypothetical protein